MRDGIVTKIEEALKKIINTGKNKDFINALAALRPEVIKVLHEGSDKFVKVKNGKISFDVKNFTPQSYNDMAVLLEAATKRVELMKELKVPFSLFGRDSKKEKAFNEAIKVAFDVINKNQKSVNSSATDLDNIELSLQKENVVPQTDNFIPPPPPLPPQPQPHPRQQNKTTEDPVPNASSKHSQDSRVKSQEGPLKDVLEELNRKLKIKSASFEPLADNEGQVSRFGHGVLGQAEDPPPTKPSRAGVPASKGTGNDPVPVRR